MRCSDLIKKLADLHPNAILHVDTPQGRYEIAEFERVDIRWGVIITECLPNGPSEAHDTCSPPCPLGSLTHRESRDV